MLPFTKSLAVASDANLAADNDVSQTLFTAAVALEANAYENIRALVTVFCNASNAGKTVAIEFLSKATADGASSTWTTVQQDAAVAVADAAGHYVVEAVVPARLFASKYANVEAVVAHADPGTDILVTGLVLIGELARRDV